MPGHKERRDRVPNYPYSCARTLKSLSVPLKCTWPAIFRPLLGFTLVELLTVLAIAAIFTAMALPSFQGIGERNRVAADVNKLVRALNLARSEAIKRRVRTILCKSSNPEASLPTCSGSWTQGWILFADTDDDKQFGNNEPLLAVHNGLKSGNTLKLNAFISNDYLQYLPSGTTNQNGTFTICGGSKDKYYARGIIISRSGRVRLSYDSDPLTCP